MASPGVDNSTGDWGVSVGDPSVSVGMAVAKGGNVALPPHAVNMIAPAVKHTPNNNSKLLFLFM
jgi:hypothetical protein